MGGLLVTKFAARHPSHVKRLILICPAGTPISSWSLNDHRFVKLIYFNKKYKQRTDIFLCFYSLVGWNSIYLAIIHAARLFITLPLIGRLTLRLVTALTVKVVSAQALLKQPPLPPSEEEGEGEARDNSELAGACNKVGAILNKESGCGCTVAFSARVPS
jgi:pimeloyl-ACP methyl ester carboxylesterase